MPRTLSATQELIVCVGPAVDLTEANRLHDVPTLEKTSVAHVATAAELPDRWYGYEGVDWLVFSTSDPAAYQDFQFAGVLNEWIQMGGRLLLPVGSQAEHVAQSPLALFLPGRVQRSQSLRAMQLEGIETYVESSERLASERSMSGAAVLEVPKLIDVQGSIEAFAGANPRELPLVVRSPRGFGQIVFCGFDLDHALLVHWPARGQLLNKLLGRTKTAQHDEAEDNLAQLASAGYTDLSGQLRSALDQFSQVQPMSFWSIAGLMLLYVVLISPLDYLLVKSLKRFNLAWLTFPTVVILSSVGAYRLARTVKGNDLLVNQVDLVDVDMQSQVVRGTSWLTVFSPQSATYDIAFQPQSLDAATESPPLLSWLGLPGSGFGGMDSPTAGATLYSQPYSMSLTSGKVNDVPIPIWSTKSFTARWHGTAPPLVENKLASTASRKLSGSVPNPLNLPLTDAVLFYDHWAYSLGPIAATGKIAINSEPRSIDGYLTQRKLVEEKDVATPYDRFSFDVPRILQILTFHEAAGGRLYTRLLNRYDNYLELTDQLKLGRAVLLAFGPPASDVQLDGRSLAAAQRDQRRTLYRLVFPVRHDE